MELWALTDINGFWAHVFRGEHDKNPRKYPQVFRFFQEKQLGFSPFVPFLFANYPCFGAWVLEPKNSKFGISIRGVFLLNVVLFHLHSPNKLVSNRPCVHIGVSKNRVFPPKWMMVYNENPY